METKRDLVKLKDCPVGFFIYKGTLCFKTEYGETIDNVVRHDVYVCESGEFFWGGAKTVDEREILPVKPVDIQVVKCVVDVPETPAVLQEKLVKEAEARKKQADIISEERIRRYEQIRVIDNLKKELEQIKKERDAAMKFIPKDCETCAYWRPKEENICVAPKGVPCHWGKREAWKWCGAKEE